MQMRWTILIPAILSAAALSGTPPGARLRLEDVMRAAIVKAKIEDARADLARNTLRFLDTQNRLRVEFRPALSLFSFSNPVLLATSLGGGLSINRRTAPGFAAMDGARFDALAAEVNAETLKVRVQLEAARAYFDLLEKQQIAQLSEAMLERRKRSSADVGRLLQAARITAADKLSYEQELLDLEWQWLNAETERKSAAARLGRLIGAGEPAHQIAVEDVALRGVGAIPAPVEELLQLALEHRNESRLLRDKIGTLRGAPAKKAGFDGANAGYAFVNNKTGLSNVLTNNILGGHTGHADVGVRIPLKNTGERDAHDAVTAARIRLLELEIGAMEDSVRMEVAALTDAAASSLEKERLAGRKLEVARQSAEIVRARAENGLTPMGSAWAADQAVLAAESAWTRAVNERKASLYALLVVCGIDKGTEALEQRSAVTR